MKIDMVDILGELLSVEVLFDLMGQDKKVVDGILWFIFVWGIGDVFVILDVLKDVVFGLLCDNLW